MKFRKRKSKKNRKSKAGTLSLEEAVTKIQSLRRGKTTRKHTKRLELYNNLPKEVQKLVSKNYNKMLILERENTPLLLKGAEEGDLAKVRHALDNYADIKAKDEHGWTALLNASYYAHGHTDDHKDLVQLLIERGADINDKDEIGWTPLHIAIRMNYQGLVELFLDAGADKNAKTESKWTPLHIACEWGRIEIVRILLDAHVNVNAKDVTGYTPLHYASKQGHTEIVQLLENYTYSTPASGKKKRKKRTKKKRRH